MGAGGAKGAKGAIDEQGLAQQYKLSPDQIHALVAAFKSGADSKTEIDKERFIKVVQLVRASRPELASFEDEIAGLVFTLCDTDHSGKVDPLEVVAALAIFSSGDNEEKAKLVFKTIDKNGDGALTKDEIKKHTAKVVSFSASLVKADIKNASKAAGLGLLGSMAGAATSAGLGAAEKQFAEDVARDVLTLDKSGDGKITLDEWLNGVKTNTTVQVLVDPNLSANAWRVVIDPEGGDDGNRILDEVAKHPKGFAHIFELEIEQGKFKPTGKGSSAAAAAAAAAAPATLKLTLSFASTTSIVEINSTAKLSELRKAAETFSKVPIDNIALRAGDQNLRIDSDTLQSFKLKDGDVIKIYDVTVAAGPLHVRTLTGKTIEIQYTAKDTVASLKQQLQDKEGIPPDQQRLIYDGREMDSARTAADYAVVPDSIVCLVLRLRASP